jgi:hypothetical protein
MTRRNRAVLVSEIWVFPNDQLMVLPPEAMGAFSNIKGLSMYQDNNEDPYITLKDVSRHAA